VERKIRNFIEFINEADGFGSMPFLFRKDGDLCYYMFNLGLESGETKGFSFIIGKYSQYETTEGPKNSYAVLNLNEIAPEEIQDIAVNNNELPELNDITFNIEGNDLVRLFNQASKALMSYLEKNPSVVRIFDEMNLNCKAENYMEKVKSVIVAELGNEWSMQEGSEEKTYIISR